MQGCFINKTSASLLPTFQSNGGSGSLSRKCRTREHSEKGEYHSMANLQFDWFEFSNFTTYK